MDTIKQTIMKLDANSGFLVGSLVLRKRALAEMLRLVSVLTAQLAAEQSVQADLAAQSNPSDQAETPNR